MFSIFEGSKLPLVTLYRLIFYCFVRGTTQVQEETQTGIYDTKVRERIEPIYSQEKGNYNQQNPPEKPQCLEHIKEILRKSLAKLFEIHLRKQQQKSMSFLESLYIEIQELGYIMAALYDIMVWIKLGMKEYVNHSRSFGLGQDKTNRIQSIWSEIKSLGSFYSSLNFYNLNIYSRFRKMGNSILKIRVSRYIKDNQIELFL
ncbi:hypothetical protein ABPG72_020850 [Tetrahymena utriculariae]